MKREIKKKTISYGIAAVLLAVLLTAIVYNFGVQPYISTSPVLQLKTFLSYEELENFLKTSMREAQSFQEWGLSPFVRGTQLETLGPADKMAPAHSTTNIQVAGVDEADSVKTDGEYLYVVSGSTIYIARAYPPDQAKVLSKITLNATFGAEIYVNGDKLAVLGKHFNFYESTFIERTPIDYIYADEAFLKVFNISDRANPILTRTIRLNGAFSGSRMIGDYIYAVVNQFPTRFGSNTSDVEVILPKIVTDDSVKEIQPTEIWYVNVPDVYYYFTTIIAVNIKNDVQEPTHETFLAGSATNMYVSESNMYLAVPNTAVWIMTLETDKVKEETLIYRVKLDKEKIDFEAQGAVLGYVLNQFSMDEYEGFFRIATTKGWGNASVNSLYVLNMSLSIVGKLEGLAPGERIYSARFMGDRCYLVTFEQIDPFFVIDLSNPTKPEVLGYLKIPGFSVYLHPYDDNHIIGIGKQDDKVKLSLFDVTNFTEPTEKDKFFVPGVWSDSTVLMDHKAFLFDKSKQLLAIPVIIGWIEAEYGAYYKNSFWQGAYIFNISLEQGFTTKGTITHQDDAARFEWGFEVKRILYINDVLYTVSDKKVRLNNLWNLDLLNEILLG